MSTAELEKVAIWQIEDPITDEQLDFAINEARRTGQFQYEYLGKVACLKAEDL